MIGGEPISERIRSIDALAREHLAAGDAAHFVSLVRPAVRLEHVAHSHLRTRLGGSPILEPDVTWPHWGTHPLSFFMLLDAGDLRGLEIDIDLPPSGLLNFFYEADTQQAWGFDPAHAGGWRVVLTDPSRGTAMPAPAGALTFPEIPLVATQVVTAAGWDEPSLGDLWERDRDGLSALDAALEERWPGPPRHQIGGWPILEQSPIWLECQLASNGIFVGGPEGYEDPRAQALEAGAGDWQLLAQIETDDAAGWMWGDAGTLYYAIRRQDLAAQRFDRVWMILQSG